jgi:hypothetical protein
MWAPRVPWATSNWYSASCHTLWRISWSVFAQASLICVLILCSVVSSRGCRDYPSQNPTKRNPSVSDQAISVIGNKTLVPSTNWCLTWGFLLYFCQNCHRTVTTDFVSWNTNTENAFSGPYAILSYWQM